MTGLSTKVAAGTFGAALATLIWTILASTVDAVGQWPAETLATVVGATGTVLAGFLGWLTRETATGGIDDTTALEAVSDAPAITGDDSTDL